MPRNVNVSLKAADRIPGLRPKVEKPRGAPPPWVDWIHKFGPLFSVIASAAIFVFTVKYTIEPVYRRALLEEANARLEIESQSAKQRLLAVNDLVAKSTADLKAKTEQIGSLSAQIDKQNRVASDASQQATIATTKLADVQAALVGVKQDLGRKTEALDDTKASLDETQKQLIEVVVDTTAGWGKRKLPPCVVKRFNATVSGFASTEDYTLTKCVSATLEANDALLRRLPESIRLQFQQLAARIDAESEPKLLELAKSATAESREYELLRERHARELDKLPSNNGLQSRIDARRALITSQRATEEKASERVKEAREAISKIVDNDHSKFVTEMKANSVRAKVAVQ